METKKHKIPLLLKLKRLKNSKFIDTFNTFISKVKPAKRYSGVPKRLLLFRNDRIGDAVVTLPVIRDLKMNYPDMIIDVVVSPINKIIFEEFEYTDHLIELDLIDYRAKGLLKLPFIGAALQFFKYIFFPFIFSSAFREKLEGIKSNYYDAAADLVGLKRNAIVAGSLSGFTIGPGKLAAFLFYDFYTSSNWVSAGDVDFMTRKIENTLTDALGLELTKRNNSQPLVQYRPENEYTNEGNIDIIFHFGTSPLRKLSIEKEIELIRSLSGYRIIITDSEETEGFSVSRESLKNEGNISFRIYPSLKSMIKDCLRARLLVSYDGGQCHYLGQFVRTIALFGPGSVSLWKPYEFENYSSLETDINGTTAIISAGSFRHIAIYKPVWCNPCFDIGCKDRPCISGLRVEFIANIIRKYCLNGNK